MRSISIYVVDADLMRGIERVTNPMPSPLINNNHHVYQGFRNAWVFQFSFENKGELCYMLKTIFI